MLRNRNLRIIMGFILKWPREKLNLLEQFILFLVSLVANTFSAFSGGGAGLLQFPVLIFLGLSFGVALATHKVASVAHWDWARFCAICAAAVWSGSLYC